MVYKGVEGSSRGSEACGTFRLGIKCVLDIFIDLEVDGGVGTVTDSSKRTTSWNSFGSDRSLGCRCHGVGILNFTLNS